jgi:hypothetical protein
MLSRWARCRIRLMMVLTMVHMRVCAFARSVASPCPRQRYGALAGIDTLPRASPRWPDHIPECPPATRPGGLSFAHVRCYAGGTAFSTLRLSLPLTALPNLMLCRGHLAHWLAATPVTNTREAKPYADSASVATGSCGYILLPPGVPTPMSLRRCPGSLGCGCPWSWSIMTYLVVNNDIVFIVVYVCWPRF